MKKITRETKRMLTILGLILNTLCLIGNIYAEKPIGFIVFMIIGELSWIYNVISVFASMNNKNERKLKIGEYS